MKKTSLFFKVIISCVFVVMIFLLTACGEWEDYEYNKDDFSLKVTVSKTTASVGDTIEITAELENLSGISLPVLFHDYHAEKRDKIEHVLYIRFVREGESHDMVVTSAWFRPQRSTLKENAIVTYKESHEIQELVDYEVSAFAYFYIGKDRSFEYHKNKQNDIIYVPSDIVKITVI